MYCVATNIFSSKWKLLVLEKVHKKFDKESKINPHAPFSVTYILLSIVPSHSIGQNLPAV